MKRLTKDELSQKRKFELSYRYDILMVAIQYVLSRGEDFVKSITEQDIDDMKEKIKDEEVDAEKHGKILLTTPEYQESIVRCAIALVKLDKNVRYHVIFDNI